MMFCGAAWEIFHESLTVLGLFNLIANEPDVSQGGRDGVVQRHAGASQTCLFTTNLEER